MSSDSDTKALKETTTFDKKINDESKDFTFQLKQEQLDIARKWVQTGEVKIYRETYTEEKNFLVPVSREELVIEKKCDASQKKEYKDVATEVIRIPISEERVAFTKEKIDLEQVSIYKQQIEDIKHIEEIVRREEPVIKTHGFVEVKEQSDL